jgi:uncharacterized RDD family membrane protein YckC
MTTEPDPTPVTKPAPTGYRYAGAWIRLFALVIDGLLLFAIVYVLFIVLGGVLYLAYPQAADSVLAGLDSNTWPAGLLSYIVLSVVMLAWYGGWQAGIGATPGMLVLKLRVRDPDGEDNPSLRAAVIRNSPQVFGGFGELTGVDTIDLMLGVVSFVVYAAIGLSITNNPQYQGFHDRLAGGTYVVRRG